MSLSARERHALSSIEAELAGSDPDLVAKLTAFSQTGSSDEMPPTERCRTGWRRVFGALFRWLGGPPGHSPDGSDNCWRAVL